MASVTVRDMTEPSGSTSWTASGGYAQDRVYMVTFDDDGEVIEGDSRSRALDAMDVEGVPANRSQHPVWKWKNKGLILLGKDVETKSSSQFIITCSFGMPSVSEVEPSDAAASATISVSSTIVETETQFDNKGDEIITAHFREKNTLVPLPVRGSVRDHAVTMVVRYDRLELGGPAGKARTHVGRLNSATVFGDPARTWLCSEISGTSTDRGVTYNVSYEFIRSPKVKVTAEGTNEVEPWDATIVEIDPNTGTFVVGTVQLPLTWWNDGTQYGGKRIVQVKGQSDFTDLDLTFVAA